MKNLLTAILLTVSSVAAPVHLSDEVPLSIKRVSPEVILVDFGQVSFGNIRLVPPAGSNQQISVHFGEDLREGRVNRKPQGTVRYATTRLHLSGSKPVTAAPAADGRDTQNTFPNTPPAVLPPPEWGVVLPFRWVEIEGWPGELLSQDIVRKSAFSSTWDDDAASFESSDAMLNRIWDLCRYSIKATTFMSQHASLFPLAFSLVPEEQIQAVVKGVQKHGMACSVYAAQYLMEGLFANQAGTRALELITAPTDRSWRHMVESGTTITWEAWDMKYKPNQDWNHAWGAAPANLLPRFILGKDHHQRRPRNGEARRVTLDRG